MPRRPVYQFKIELEELESPLPIWRRIQVSDLYSFWDLHVAIQNAMGWTDSHLHDFIIPDPITGAETHIGIPDPQEDVFEILTDLCVNVRDYFNESNKVATYLYDYGDSWVHRIEFEGKFAKQPKKRYPVCLDGAGCCPPEDVGGISGYIRFLEIIKNPQDSEYEEMINWLGYKFDPHKFNPKSIKFESPKRHLEIINSDDF